MTGLTTGILTSVETVVEPSAGSPTTYESGSGNFTVPTFNTLTVKVWGGGGYTTTSYLNNGANAADTSFNTTVIAEGGHGSTVYTGGVPGSWSGGDSGSDGGYGETANAVYGPAALGGAAADSGYGDGQNGAFLSDGAKSPTYRYHGAGAGGGYTTKTYLRGELTPGDLIPYVIGAGYENGRIEITWT